MEVVVTYDNPRNVEEWNALPRAIYATPCRYCSPSGAEAYLWSITILAFE